MKRFFFKALKVLAYFSAIFIVLLVAIYIEEDWRGARDWATCQQELAAKGESLELRQLASPGKPEDDLSKVPIFAELYQEFDEYQKPGISTIKPRIKKIKIRLMPSNEWNILPKAVHFLEGECIDLPAWQKYYRATPEAHLPAQIGTPAQDVLQALSQFDSGLDEVDQAVGNPNAYWPLPEPPKTHSQLKGQFIGGAASLGMIAVVIQLNAVAHLDNHESDLAEKDYLACLRLAQPLSKLPLMINFSVAAEVRAIANSILWEGLRRHAWTDAQLREMETAPASTDMLAFAVDAFRVERASLINSLPAYQSLNPDVVRIAEENDSFYGLGLNYLPLSRLRPNGWWDEDRSAYCREMQGRIDAFDLGRGTLALAPFSFHDMSDSWGWNRAKTNVWNPIYVPFTTLSGPYFDNVLSTIAEAETYRRLGRLACRLEEYRLAHGTYPENLTDLPDLPPLLNQEVVSTNPFHYQPKGDSYKLYSLGGSQKDNGGKPGTDSRKENWPWPSP